MLCVSPPQLINFSSVNFLLNFSAKGIIWNKCNWFNLPFPCPSPVLSTPFLFCCYHPCYNLVPGLSCRFHASLPIPGLFPQVISFLVRYPPHPKNLRMRETLPNKKSCEHRMGRVGRHELKAGLLPVLQETPWNLSEWINISREGVFGVRLC